MSLVSLFAALAPVFAIAIVVVRGEYRAYRIAMLASERALATLDTLDTFQSGDDAAPTVVYPAPTPRAPMGLRDYDCQSRIVEIASSMRLSLMEAAIIYNTSDKTKVYPIAQRWQDYSDWA